MNRRSVFTVRLCLLLILALTVVGLSVQAFEAPEQRTALQSKQFFERELYISSTHEKLDVTALRQLVGDTTVDDFLEANGPAFRFFMDPRSGTMSNVIGRVPLIPGTGAGNERTLASLSAELGRPVTEVDAQVVTEVVHGFIVRNAGVIGIDPSQLGASRTTQVTETLWQVSIPQQVNGVPVRHGRTLATLNHGNLVLLGTETWGNAVIDTMPAITGEQAVTAGFIYVGGMDPQDAIWREPTLEIVPIAPPQYQSGDAYVGPVGSGYGHRLVWTFGFRRVPDFEKWEILVDAHTGDVIAMQDTNHYATEEIVGGIYPLTSTEICPNNETCGTMQTDHPMPWADTGQSFPDNFTNSHGLFEYTAGNTSTQLDGLYMRIDDNCGNIQESTDEGTLDLGGVNGEHDCDSSGDSPGNTASSRSCFYELNKLAEAARGYLPGNSWLTEQLTANVNINSTCNAGWNGNSVNFFKSGGGCRNTGEIAAVFDHEWGHGLDDNDANGNISNSGEAYADIVAIYRLHASCVGFGFRHTSDQGCGETSDGTGFNDNESQHGTHCVTDCSGVRDTDWMKHEDQNPDTPQNFVCDHCFNGSGPCGRQTHCSAAPTRQAAWDFVARDLRVPPYDYNDDMAFIVGNKIFYHGSGNVGAWHACSCPNSSNGCGAANGYMQWLAADDDNGNLDDGTPHMPALYAAFNRHNIACDDPAPQAGGCAGGPTQAPSVTASSTIEAVTVEWSAVPNAFEYRVFRTEGYAGCDFGKALIATVAGTSYTDPGLAREREYSYVVQAVGSTGECYGITSECITIAAGGANLAVHGYLLDDTCNGVGLGGGNGSAEPGEDVVMTLSLRNVGSGSSSGISAQLIPQTPGVTLTQGSTTFPDLGVGESAFNNGTPFSFTVDDDLPCGALLHFDLETTANEGSWTNLVQVSLSADFTGNCAECEVVAPGLISGLTWSDRDSMDWTPATGASYYHLYRGFSIHLPNLLDESDDSCHRLTTVDPATGPILSEPPPLFGVFYWYLVVPGNGSGDGSAGNATAGPRVRDGDFECVQ